MFKWGLSIFLSVTLLAGMPCLADASEDSESNSTSKCFTGDLQERFKNNMLGLAELAETVSVDIVILSIAGATGSAPDSTVTGDYFSGKPSAEHQCIEKFKSLKSTNENIINAGKELFESTCYEEALIVFNVVTRCYPEEADAYYGIARINSLKGDFDTALKKLQVAVSLSPELKGMAPKDIYFYELRGMQSFKDIFKE